MRQIAFGTLLLLICHLSVAQITLGPQFGVNLNQQNSGSAYETWKVGTTLGGVLNIPIYKDFSFQPEVLLSQKGYRLEYDGSNSYDELTAKYLELPLLIHWEYPLSKLRVFGNVGPYFGYWRSGTYESKITGSEVIVEDYAFTETFDADGYKDNRTDYGMVVGVGVLYDRVGAAGNIVLDIRYSKGLAPLSSNQGASTTPDRTNSTWTISLAYMFYL